MDEQRLIDANKLLEKQECLYMRGNILFHGVTAHSIENAPTIDPESLPIVQQLREELARVTAERNAVYSLPVKPGDKVYQQNGVDVYELEVKKIIFDCGHIAFDESAIGKTVFLTEPAAQAALEGGTPDAKAD